MKALLNGGTINYLEKGDHSAMPVTFLHGFPFSHEMWNAQLEVVSTKYRAVAYDIRGHGYSDVGDGQFTIEGHVDDLVALLDHLKIPKTVVVGLSMGGYITLRALQRHPGRFSAAVLCDTRSEADTDESRLKRFTGVKSVKQDGSAQFADDFVKVVFAPASLTRRPDAVAFIHKIIERTSPLSIAGTLIALASRTDTTASLPAITVPTLILVGEHDAITPPAASRAMHGKIVNSELRIIPGAGHMSNLENPDVFNHTLMSFLERVATLPATALPRPLS
jgi:3-oxoadipate enol-lactonase